MLLRKPLLFATLLAIVTLAEPVTHRAKFDQPHPHTLLRASAPAAAALLWKNVLPGESPSESPSESLSESQSELPGELLPASFLPIQLRNPKDLGIGKLLVASRGIGDPRFAKTVILLVNYDENGVIGLVLNRRTTVPLSQVLDLKATKARSDPVYLGGPMEPSVAFALFQSPPEVKATLKKAKNIFGSVYLITEKDLFEKTISARPDPKVFHVYMGYAGWTQAQLRAEIQLGAWFVFPADAAIVFNSNPGSLWQQMIQKTQLKLATIPFVQFERGDKSHSDCLTLDGGEADATWNLQTLP